MPDDVNIHQCREDVKKIDVMLETLRQMKDFGTKKCDDAYSALHVFRTQLYENLGRAYCQ